MTLTGLARHVVLGAVIGALLATVASAQVRDTTRVRRDTTRARPDTTHRDTVPSSVPIPARPPRDTIKAPLARAEAPVLIGIGQTLRWDRDALFASGALTLQDLLDRVPGVTGLRAGYISAPMVTSYLGDATRIRFFIDGMEMNALDPRGTPPFDLTQIQIWSLEELRIERGANELRIYMRSWRVDRTTPYTRTDVSTGDQQTNLYRGFFGRRWEHGEALQVGAQQYGTTPNRVSGSSDQLGVVGRVGWARGALSLDGFMMRTSRHRATIRSVGPVVDSIPGVESARIDAYLRAGYGDPERGPWIQALAGLQRYSYPGDTTGRVVDTLPDSTIVVPNADTLAYRSQYLITGGITKFGVHVSGAERLQMFNGKTYQIPSARAAFETRWVAASAFAEGKNVDSTARVEVAAKLSPLPFIAVTGTASWVKNDQKLIAAPTGFWLRGEAGVRVGQLWLTGGVIRRDSATLTMPRVFIDTTQSFQVNEPNRTAYFGTIQGSIYKDLRANIYAVRWNDTSALYRPQYQTRAEIYLQTNWLGRFPSGNFGFLFSVVHEYRSRTRFQLGLNDFATTPDSRTISTLLELRILQAVAFWQFRNVMGDTYFLVPSYLMPRQTQFYGVRWDFWN